MKIIKSTTFLFSVLLLSTIIIGSCSSGDSENSKVARIEGKLDGITQDTIFLRFRNPNKETIGDSSMVADGKFSFNIETSIPQVVTIYTRDSTLDIKRPGRSSVTYSGLRLYACLLYTSPSPRDA